MHQRISWKNFLPWDKSQVNIELSWWQLTILYRLKVSWLDCFHFQWEALSWICMEKQIIKEDLKTSSIVRNCAGYDVKYFRVRNAFFKVFRLSQELVITNNFMQYNEQPYNERNQRSVCLKSLIRIKTQVYKLKTFCLY